MKFATIGGERPLRGLVVGAGTLGPHWARELIDRPDCELAGWVDQDPVRARRHATTFDLPALATGSDLDEMINRLRPDFVVNVTPPEAHLRVTLAALEAGAAVLTEKPLASTAQEAAEMVATADRTGRLLMVSQNRRYHPGLVAYRKAVEQLGRLTSLRCDFYIPHRGDHTTFVFSFAHPLLLDMAVHLFDAARAITGADPVSVYSDAWQPGWSWFQGPAAAHAMFTMTGELRFSFDGNWVADGFATSWTGTWRAIGELGTAIWDGAVTVAVDVGPGVTPPVAQPIVPPPADRFQGLTAALDEFVIAVRTGRIPQGECHDNVKSLAMCHAAVASASSGERIAIELSS